MLALALPLVLTELTQVLITTTEVVMLGRLSAQRPGGRQPPRRPVHTA